MPYTEKQLTDASLISCLDFDTAIKSFIVDGRKGPYKIRDLITEYIDYDNVRDKLAKEGKDITDLSFQELVQYSDMSELNKQLIPRLSDETLNWKISDIHDTREENGMYACVVETSEKSAIVSFRRSEGLDNYSGLIKDWGKANLGLLNNRETDQQMEVERYADKLIKNGVISKYDNLAATGHSLGGNLASHFGVISACGQRKELFDKLSQVANLDGAGFSEEYIQYFNEEIKAASDKITHYRWSPVGHLLMDLPGENIVDLDVMKYSDTNCRENKIGRLTYDTFYKHDTNSLIFDENGNAKRGDVKPFDKAFGNFSKFIEKVVPPSLTWEIYEIVSAEFSKFAYEKEDGKIGIRLFPNMKQKDEKQDKNNMEVKCGYLKAGLLNSVIEKANQTLTTMRTFSNNTRIYDGR